MTQVISDQSVEANDGSKNVLDLGLVVGELTLEDDAASEDDVSLEGLEQELQDYKTDDVVFMILSKGTESRNYTKDVENNLRLKELHSIQDYIKESDNLISLHDQIYDCNTILLQMEKLLSGFQAEIGAISSDIKVLQEKSLDMGLKLKNRKEELLQEHFSDLIEFVKSRACEDPSCGSGHPISVSEVEPIVKDFASRWKAAIELMHSDVITCFSNFLCGMNILRAALTQLLLYYTRLSDCIKNIPGGSALNKDLISISSIMYEITKFSRTF